MSFALPPKDDDMFWNGVIIVAVAVIVGFALVVTY